jgi:DNA-binding transcriptional regulator of glucitol operon
MQKVSVRLLSSSPSGKLLYRSTRGPLLKAFSVGSVMQAIMCSGASGMLIFNNAVTTISSSGRVGLGVLVGSFGVLTMVGIRKFVERNVSGVPRNVESAGADDPAT